MMNLQIPQISTKIISLDIGCRITKYTVFKPLKTGIKLLSIGSIPTPQDIFTPLDKNFNALELKKFLSAVIHKHSWKRCRFIVQLFHEEHFHTFFFDYNKNDGPTIGTLVDKHLHTITNYSPDLFTHDLAEQNLTNSSSISTTLVAIENKYLDIIQDLFSGFNLNILEIDTLALQRFLNEYEQKDTKESKLIIDFGFRSTRVHMFNNENVPIFRKSIPMGIDLLIDKIKTVAPSTQEQDKLLFEEFELTVDILRGNYNLTAKGNPWENPGVDNQSAEPYNPFSIFDRSPKSNESDAHHNTDEKNVPNLLQDTFHEWVLQIQKMIENLTLQENAPKKVIILGGGKYIKNINSALQTYLHIPVVTMESILNVEFKKLENLFNNEEKQKHNVDIELFSIAIGNSLHYK